MIKRINIEFDYDTTANHLKDNDTIESYLRDDVLPKAMNAVDNVVIIFLS